jgi:D-tyrosyl-tRNA(Tyr) deacylase
VPSISQLVVLSDLDPVACAVRERLGVQESIGLSVDGVALRRLGRSSASLRRAGHHVEDDDLDQRLPPSLRAGMTLIFPSIHRSAAGQHGLTVHALGNPSGSADVGGRPRRLVPAAPRMMAAVLRRLAEGTTLFGWAASYEATHHGPHLSTPAFFAEIGFGESPEPPPEAVALLAEAITDPVPDPRDRAVLGVGGGHYAPHFTELAIERRVAFGHIFARHVLTDIDRETMQTARSETPEVEGIVYARAVDVTPEWQAVAPRVRGSELVLREGRVTRSS